MSFPIIRASRTSSASANVSIDVLLPVGYQAGDILLVVVSMGSSGIGMSAPSGWTAIATGDNLTYSFWKIANGTEGSFVDLGNLLVRRWAAVSYAIYDYQGASPIEGICNPNSHATPSLTPSWGSADNLWIVVGTTQRTDNTMTVPAGYGNQLFAESTADNSSNSFASIVAGDKTSTGTSETPDSISSTGTIAEPTSRLFAIQGDPAAPETLSTDFVEIELLSTLTSVLTAGLEYAVTLEFPVTKALTYLVIAPVAVDKTSQYTIETTSDTQLDVEYQVIIDTAIPKSSKYTIQSPISLTKESTYGILIVTGLSKQLGYNIIPRHPYCPDDSPYSTLDGIYGELDSPYSPAPKVCTGFENVCES